MANRHHLAWLKVLAALLACGNLLVLNLAAQDASAPPDRSPITIYVTASHKNGSPANVTTSDLAATLDKQPVQITAVTPAQDEPLLFAMVVDISGSDAEQKQSIRKAALEIFQALSKSGNQGYLTLFNEEVAISGAPITPERAESNLEKVFFHGGTALYDAIRQTADKLNESKNQNFHRRLMVVVSDGEDNASRLSAKQLEPIVQKDGVAVYVLLIPVKHSGTQVDHVKAISRDSGGT